LLSDNLTFADKLALLRRILAVENNDCRGFVINAGEIISEYEPTPPKYIQKNPAMLRVYLDIFAGLSLLGAVNNNKLNKFFRKAVTAAEFKLPTKSQSVALIAAFFLKYIHTDNDIGHSDVCNLFGVTMQQVRKQIQNLDAIGPFRY